MSDSQSPPGLLPGFISSLISPLPRAPMEEILSRLIRSLIARRPDLMARLGDTAEVPIAVVPDDLPHAFRLSLDRYNPRVRIVDKEQARDASAIIRAPFLVLLGLLDGTFDGDAVFFSRSLRIEGRMDHVLALRNTLEEADLTPAEFAGLTGTAADLANRFAGRALDMARYMAGARELDPQDPGSAR
ncbi:ubiquinone anaerobic biosynthesis accessory factor UbiT [Roseibium aggregatum]|uniref:Lipid carrier n=1 Tax=Roseibium aggregatum TaxID=187304 RepID=A0A926P6U9_9HYPH|nr:SCP2 sterol-binding domain-containing protein [Roseibium aggregatum]MBD1549722.1 lipid carrier [Roseibium aggregatum]